ncbi:hypothetical protein OBBRIDRAFT_802150 [Obba rivulosa]|uniref:Uncharacterized protein n=1 Tax=Obba rivulosa TaxID=1052685 RepID=A0A8E2DM15_9APHY|nr:hypothetical protein OBBRIDRAFT_802150 [Obba rivulosa]
MTWTMLQQPRQDIGAGCTLLLIQEYAQTPVQQLYVFHSGWMASNAENAMCELGKIKKIVDPVSSGKKEPNVAIWTPPFLLLPDLFPLTATPGLLVQSTIIAFLNSVHCSSTRWVECYVNNMCYDPVNQLKGRCCAAGSLSRFACIVITATACRSIRETGLQQPVGNETIIPLPHHERHRVLHPLDTPQIHSMLDVDPDADDPAGSPSSPSRASMRPSHSRLSCGSVHIVAFASNFDVPLISAGFRISLHKIIKTLKESIAYTNPSNARLHQAYRLGA